MHKKYLKGMLNAVVQLSPAPVLVDYAGGRKTLADTLWRVTGVFEKHLQVETMSQTLGLSLSLFFDSIKGFQEDQFHHPSFKQGVFLLKASWDVPPEGNLPKKIWHTGG